MPKEVLLAQQVFDTQSANKLDAIADRIEGKSSSKTREVEESFTNLEQVSGKSSPNNRRIYLTLK